MKSIVRPKNEYQEECIRTMVENTISMISGPAGTGKTSLAIGLACEYLNNQKVDKIIITRPCVNTGEGLGFLPGDKREKTLPYFLPALEELKKYLDKELYQRYMEKEKIIHLEPLELMRGRNFHNAFMILDEAQNCTWEQLTMFVTRMGWDSKVVLNGDIEQCDLRFHDMCPYEQMIRKVEHKAVPSIGLCELPKQAIVRNKIISLFLDVVK